jgi:hypothetical protein
MHIVAAAELAKKGTRMTRQRRAVALTLAHVALKKKHLPMTRNPVTRRKNLAAALVAATRPVRQIKMATTRNLAA